MPSEMEELAMTRLLLGPCWEPYSLTKYSHDSVEEAVMCRRVLKENVILGNDARFVAKTHQGLGIHIFLTVVTTEVHAARADFMFRRVFEGVAWMTASGASSGASFGFVQPSETTDEERRQDRLTQEARLLEQISGCVERIGFVAYYLTRDRRAANQLGGEGSLPWLGVDKHHYAYRLVLL